MKRSVKRTMTVATVLLLAGTLAVPVFAWGPGKGRSGGQGKYGPGACWNENRPYGGSNLTEEQQGQLKALHQTHVEATMPIRNKLRAKRAEIRALMLAETLDEAKVRAVQKEINAIQADLADKRIDFQIELRKIDPNASFAGRFAGRGGKGRRGGGRGAQGYEGSGSGSSWGPGSCWN